MNINSIANQINTAGLTGDVGNDVAMSSDAKLSLIEQNLQNGFEILNSLGVGSTITGRVLMSEEDMILLSLGPNKLLEAKVSSDMIPKEGQLMTFLVNSSSSKNISLSPMFVNLNPDSNVTAALNNAGLPDNPKMQYMVKAMMEEGLPISKESLFAMNKHINEFPEYDPKILSTMTRLELPLKPEMIKQFDNYLNYEHQITSSLNDIAESFSQSIELLATESKFPEILEFTQNTVLNLFAEESEAVTDEAIINSDKSEMSSVSAPNPEVVEASQDQVLLPKNDALVNSLRNLGVLDKDIQNIINPDKNSINNNSFKEVINQIVDKITHDVIPEKTESVAKDLRAIFGDERMKEVLKEAIGNKFMLKPEQVLQKENISSLYERLNSQIKFLTNSLSSSSVGNTPLGETASNLNNNLNFMNEINQAFNYVQIPLKLNNKDASGELYVYTNKKSLSQKDGNVSALLHLDMDNLGPVDVHVMMNEQKNVKTKFFLKDDEALDLIASNIDILNKRLENRGYSMSSEFVTKDDNKSVFKTMLDESKNISVISTSSFDAKA